MRGLTQYLSWEMLAIHLLTGALFACISLIFAVALLPEHWPIAVALLPVQLFGWWGWWAEGQFVLRVSRQIRGL